MFLSRQKWWRRIKDGLFPSPAVMWIAIVCERKPWFKKNYSNQPSVIISRTNYPWVSIWWNQPLLNNSWLQVGHSGDPAGKYMFKINNRNTRIRCEMRSILTIKTPGRRQWHRSGVFIVNFEHISHLVVVFLLLTWADKYRMETHIVTFAW